MHLVIRPRFRVALFGIFLGASAYQDSIQLSFHLNGSLKWRPRLNICYERRFCNRSRVLAWKRLWNVLWVVKSGTVYFTIMIYPFHETKLIIPGSRVYGVLFDFINRRGLEIRRENVKRFPSLSLSLSSSNVTWQGILRNIFRTLLKIQSCACLRFTSSMPRNCQREAQINFQWECSANGEIQVRSHGI